MSMALSSTAHFALLRRIGPGPNLVPSQAAPLQPRIQNPLGRRVGQSRRLHRARLRRTVSIFFENGNVCDDLAPVSEYARLLASQVGIVNGLNVNNVNAAPQLIDSDNLKQIARIADTLRPWGVHLAMSVAIASPQTIGGLKTYDPLDPAVKAWWGS